MVSCKLCSAVYIRSVVCFVVSCVLYFIMCAAFCMLCCLCQNWKWWRMKSRIVGNILKMSIGNFFSGYAFYRTGCPNFYKTHGQGTAEVHLA